MPPEETLEQDDMPSVGELVAAVLDGQELAGRLGRDALAKFFESGPVLVEAMRHQSGQAEKVRQIVWSLYTGSHLVPLGHVCSGLDTKVAEAVAAVISARLLIGAEIEEKLGLLMKAAGEFDRCKAVETAHAAKGLPACYPLPLESPARLRELADLLETQP